MFLTPHVVRNKTDLRALALDQRARFVNSLGPREMRDMPSSSIRSMYDPTFSVAVPPAADLNIQNNHASQSRPGRAPEGDKPTPFNTEEIPAPTSSLSVPSSAPAAVSVSPAAPSAAAPSAAVPSAAAPSAATSMSTAPAIASADPRLAPASADPAAGAAIPTASTASAGSP